MLSLKSYFCLWSRAFSSITMKDTELCSLIMFSFFTFPLVIISCFIPGPSDVFLFLNISLMDYLHARLSVQKVSQWKTDEPSAALNRVKDVFYTVILIPDYQVVCLASHLLRSVHLLVSSPENTLQSVAFHNIGILL